MNMSNSCSYNLNSTECSQVKSDISHEIRTDHMNKEYKQLILKLIKEYADIFQSEYKVELNIYSNV